MSAFRGEIRVDSDDKKYIYIPETHLTEMDREELRRMMGKRPGGTNPEIPYYRPDQREI
jgi:hypothetical protein